MLDMIPFNSVLDTLPRYALALLAISCLYGAYRLLSATYIWPNYISALRTVPGPENPSFLYGNYEQIYNAPDEAIMLEQWGEQHGHVLKFNGPFNEKLLYTSDLRALGHILNKTDVYEKQDRTRRMLASICGWGVLVAEGDPHRMQRRIINPAFGPAQIRDLTGIFLDKANELREQWQKLVDTDPVPLCEKPTSRIDALSTLSRCTLDIIGLGGFSYNFDSLARDADNSGSHVEDELHEAFKVVFSERKITMREVLANYIPVLKLFPTKRDRKITLAQSIMRRIGQDMVRHKKESVQLEKLGSLPPSSRPRDLLSLLIRNNMAPGLPESQRLSDEDVLAQIPTFLIAGHETTATAITWAFYSLACRPELQQALREELRRCPLPTDSTGCAPLENDVLTELQSLPLFDAVIRESLRLFPPAPSTNRTANKDDAIPLERPYVDIHGTVHDSIMMKKGDSLVVPILAINRSKEIWGPDAHEWKPERWLSMTSTEVSSGIPGVWSGLLSFIGGSHHCVAYRFAVIEMKIIIHALVSAFEFRLAVDPSDIARKTRIVQRPLVLSEKGKGAQLPLLVTPVVS